MYQNSNKVFWNVKDNYHCGNESYMDHRHDKDGKKSLYFKIMDTMNRYCFEENISRELIDTVMLTGGAMQLGSNSG